MLRRLKSFGILIAGRLFMYYLYGKLGILTDTF